MRRVEFIMGMPISIDIWKCQDEKVFKNIFTRLQSIDHRFSPYKKASEVSRLRDGLIAAKNLNTELKIIIEGCKKAQATTNGYFSAWASGTFDPSGYVKGWAIAEAGKAIEKEGHRTYCIGAGGDILARSNSDKIWQIGIQDPQTRDKILNKLSISNGAVATSGNYERGAHIVNPKTKEEADELLSATVTGPEIIEADVLATAIFAMGASGLDFMEKQKGYEALLVSKRGQVQMTSKWPR